MEKHTPSYKLSIVKQYVALGRVHATSSALSDAGLLGMNFGDMMHVIMSLAPSDFYKSMTTYANHRIWQDVYKPNTPFGNIYLKLTVLNDVVIVSFKKR
ncbi:type II toxin-antitoxin system MqsR family toxin [Duganella radicis]|uniref:mRNA interferase MqsR n=1 Tax=Duganella radicis TaxID=551988 RepID=A0A6L6PJG9_9BURK|nr:type II toxin-antitoxin system MqsR family toxin [Duganella radicis]MTV39228.1 mRNA interferase MqsR [Duganella radicis]